MGNTIATTFSALIIVSTVVSAGNLQADALLPVESKGAFRIGMTCQLSGPLAQYGAKYFQEISTSVDKINASNGINGRMLYLSGPSAVKEIPEQFLQNKKMMFFMFNKTRQMIAFNSGSTYTEFIDALVCDAYDSDSNKTKAVDCIRKLIDRDILVVLSQAVKAELESIAQVAGNARVPVVFFTSRPEAVSLPSNDWVFTGTPFAAISAVAEALERAGSDREEIRKFLLGRLGQKDR